MIHIDSKRKKIKTLQSTYPNAILADVTSKANDSLKKLSPFYPHGQIPVPFSIGTESMSVEGIWQGLKVFQNADIDPKCFDNNSMKNLKRTVRKFGKPLGHKKGLSSSELLEYIEARILIYLPSYRWVLENKVSNILSRLIEANLKNDIVLLDYNTNCNIFDDKRPLSHAYLVKLYAEGSLPTEEELLIKYHSNDDLNLSDNIWTNKI